MRRFDTIGDDCGEFREPVRRSFQRLASLAEKGGGKGGGGKTEQTQTTAPWGPQIPHLQTLFSSADALRKQPALNDLQNQALQGITTTAQTPGLMPMAMDAAGRTISGEMLGPASNPWIQQVADKAAGDTAAMVNSQFSAAGRTGSGAHTGALTEGIGNVYSNTFADNYNRERGIQVGAIQQAPAMDAARFNDLNQLLRAGTIQQDAPWDQLQRFQAAIAGNYGSTTTETAKNKAAKGGIMGGLGGAGTGAAIGSALTLSNPATAALVIGGGLLGAM